MSAENFDIGALQEGVGGSQEVSEEEKQKVAEQGAGARQAHGQVVASQIKNEKFALFLSKVLKRYFSNINIINLLFSLLQDFEKNEDAILYIFSPFIENDGFDSISDYINYINKQSLSEYKNLILEITEFEKIGGEVLWDSLKKGNSKISYTDFKQQILNDIK